jgi:uncharacterized protein
MPEILINGPAGRLECRYTPGKSPVAPIALILHPHPQHGGTMNNKNVYSLFHAFSDRGFSTLRFNFRGVGKSQGSYGDGEGELADAASALDWLQAVNPNTRQVWVAGFSFGAWIAMQLLMRRPEIESYVAVAPPANMFDFSFLAPCPSSGLIIHGEKDELVPEASVAALVQKLAKQKDITTDYRVIPGANHFFNQHALEMETAVDGYLDQILGVPRVAMTA